MNSHFMYWKSIGSIQNTHSYRYVRKYLPETFKKHCFELFTSKIYFNAANIAAEALIDGFVMLNEYILKMRMYMKAEHQIIMLYQLHIKMNKGIGRSFPLPRKISVNFPLELTKIGLEMELDLIAVFENSRDVIGGNWVMSAKLKLCNEKHQEKLSELSELSDPATVHKLIYILSGCDVSDRWTVDEYDYLLSECIKNFSLTKLNNITRKFGLDCNIEWELPGQVATVNIRIPEKLSEVMYMNQLVGHAEFPYPFILP